MAIIRENVFPTDRLDPSLPAGLILCGMGGPDAPEAVRPFLRNLFRDPMIFPAPKLVAPALGWLISTLRAPNVRKRHALIDPNCVSPQMETTRLQAVATARHLESFGIQADPGIAMRYWRPYPRETVHKLVARGARQFAVVPMYPQYSSATGGSTLDFVVQAIREALPEAPVHTVTGWGLLPSFLHALAAPTIARLSAWAAAGAPAQECALVYVAHSLPQSFIDEGDPYQAHTLATVAAVNRLVVAALEEAGHGAWSRELESVRQPVPAYQSRVGPIKWLGPEITARVTELAQAGCKRLHVQPVSFTCEHIETIIELDGELRELAEQLGVSEFSRGAALNMDDDWLKGMAAMLADQVFGAEVPHLA